MDLFISQLMTHSNIAQTQHTHAHTHHNTRKHTRKNSREKIGMMLRPKTDGQANGRNQKKIL